jgi:hypothetical protein
MAFAGQMVPSVTQRADGRERRTARSASRPQERHSAPSARTATIARVANSFDFLVALDDAVRASSHATVTNAQQMLGIARDARLSQNAEEVARWTGELVDADCLRHGPLSAADHRPLPPLGVSWQSYDLSRISEYRLTPAGHQGAQRTRDYARQQRTDAALGQRYPRLSRSCMTESQVRAVADPLHRLRDALDAERAVAAVGAAKDLVEAACKVSLQRAGEDATRAEKLPALFKLAAASLPGEAHEIGRSVVGAVQRLAELRNASGAGHGHAELADVPAAYARLAGTVAVAVADFVLGE